MSAKLAFTVEQVREAYAGDASVKQAAAKLGCSQEALRRLIKQLGLSKPRRRSKALDVAPQLSDREWLGSQVASGKGDKAIAAEFGISIEQVRYWRHRHGIEPRPESERMRQSIRERFPGGRYGAVAPNWRGGRDVT